MTVAPIGGVPVTVAVLLMMPLSTSACVAMYVAEQVSVAPGASVLAGHVTALSPGNGSATTIPDRVTLPVLVTTKL